MTRDWPKPYRVRFAYGDGRVHYVYADTLRQAESAMRRLKREGETKDHEIETTVVNEGRGTRRRVQVKVFAYQPSTAVESILAFYGSSPHRNAAGDVFLWVMERRVSDLQKALEAQGVFCEINKL